MTMVPGRPLGHIQHQHNAGRSGKKASKPLMEKRRRARINQSLAQLKAMLVAASAVPPTPPNKCGKVSPNEALQQDSKNTLKFEKADILEMTVTYLQGLHRNGVIKATNTPVCGPSTSDAEKYRAGFSQCVREVLRFICHRDALMEETTRQRLLHHLSTCIQRLETNIRDNQPSSTTSGAPLSQSQQPCISSPLPCILTTSQHQSQTRYQHLVPSPASDLNFCYTPPSSPLSSQKQSVQNGGKVSPFPEHSLSPDVMSPLNLSRMECGEEVGLHQQQRPQRPHSVIVKAPPLNDHVVPMDVWRPW